jgi:hypothetical protein
VNQLRFIREVCDKVFYFNFKEVSRSHKIFHLVLFMNFFFIIFLISRLMFWWRRCVNYLLLTSLPKPLFQSKKKDFIKRCVIFSSYFLLLLVNSFSSFVSFFARKTWPSLQGGQTGRELLCWAHLDLGGMGAELPDMVSSQYSANWKWCHR